MVGENGSSEEDQPPGKDREYTLFEMVAGREHYSTLANFDTEDGKKSFYDD